MARVASRPLHVDDLETDREGRFAARLRRPNRRRPNRWVLTASIAGGALTLVAGAALLGFINSESNRGSALASIQPPETGSIVPHKNDIGGSMLDSVSLRPLGETA